MAAVCMQGMFLVLVTNKQSNILEDLDTLRLLSKVVPEYCSVRENRALLCVSILCKLRQ